MNLLFKKFVIFITVIAVSTILCFFCYGPTLAKVSDTSIISNAIYQNPEYLQENEFKTNCEVNGAWSKEYKYYWLVDPSNSQQNLPNFVKNISFRGVVQEASSTGISTLENLNLDSKRNKYYLTSSLPGEIVEITLDIEHDKQFVEWLPLSLYFDPFVVGNLKQQLKVRLSYANSSLGDIVYLQNLNFKTGCYLNLLIKAPSARDIGKVTIEIKPDKDSKAVISGLFWDEQRKENNLDVRYTGSNKLSAASYFQSQRRISDSIIWSPQNEQNLDLNKLVNVTLGEVTYTTSNGYEFPLDKKLQSYNFQVLKGKPGPVGFNGLEFYVEPGTEVCSNGCDLGFYFTENYKQNISIYSAVEHERNKLLATVATNGNESPSFENFYVAPSDNVLLRVRITTSEDSSTPVLRGLYILPAGDKTSANLVLDKNTVNSINTNIEKVNNNETTNNILIPEQPIPVPSNGSTNIASGIQAPSTVVVPTIGSVVNSQGGPVWNDPIFIGIPNGPSGVNHAPVIINTRPVVWNDTNLTVSNPNVFVNQLPSLDNIMNNSGNGAPNVINGPIWNEDKKQTMEEIKRTQEEAIKAQQEAMKKVQEEAMKKAEEMKKAQEEAVAKAAEEMNKAQQEAAMKLAEEMNKAQQEAAMKLAEEMNKAQEEAMKAQEEAMKKAHDGVINVGGNVGPGNNAGPPNVVPPTSIMPPNVEGNVGPIWNDDKKQAVSKAAEEMNKAQQEAAMKAAEEVKKAHSGEVNENEELNLANPNVIANSSTLNPELTFSHTNVNNNSNDGNTHDDNPGSPSFSLGSSSSNNGNNKNKD